MKKNTHIGSSFDEFLEEEGILDECKAEAAKRIFIWQLEEEMKKQQLTKEAIAKRMHTSRAAVDRILDSCKAIYAAIFNSCCKSSWQVS